MSNQPPFPIDPSIVMYGVSPDVDQPIPSPRVPLPVPSIVLPAFPPPLKPCSVCQRHIYDGAPCPFCFAEAVAKAPSRAALEAVRKSLLEALKQVDAALGKP
jgi:hypothetical protein